jgi:hypothetical protein
MIIFTQHSLLKLRQRSIKKQLVIKTLSAPDKVLETRGDRKAAFKKFGKLHLKVIFRREGKEVVVITQHWVEKTK